MTYCFPAFTLSTGREVDGLHQWLVQETATGREVWITAPRYGNLGALVLAASRALKQPLSREFN